MKEKQENMVSTQSDKVEEQKKHKNQRGAQKNPGHQPLQFAISISLSHAASLRRTFFYRYLITIRQKLQSF